MSAKQTGLVWELNVPQNEAWVLMAMADHADHEGNNVYPGVPRLAWKTGYSTRQIRRILAILREKGLIVVEEEGGGRKTTRYRLDLARAHRKDPHRPEYARSRRAESVPVSEPREDKMSPLPSAGPDEPMSPQPGQNVTAARHSCVTRIVREERERNHQYLLPPLYLRISGPRRPQAGPRTARPAREEKKQGITNEETARRPARC